MGRIDMASNELIEKLNSIQGAVMVSPESQKKSAKIFFDGKQYSIRIPKAFADALDIKAGRDTILFELVVPVAQNEINTAAIPKPTLKMELVRANGEEKRVQ
jgi:hypothetical protein